MDHLSYHRSFWLILRYELLIACRHYTELLNPLLFFAIILTLFPLAITPAPEILQHIAPGIIWIAILLSTLLALDKLFREDLQSGALDQLLISSQPLPLLILAKLLGHWITSSLPLILLSALLAGFLQMAYPAIKVLMETLCLGTPLLLLIGAIGRALTLRLRNSALLMFLIVLPFYIPVLIFSTSAVMAAEQGLSVSGQLAWQAVMLILALPLAPWATAAALRIEI